MVMSKDIICRGMKRLELIYYPYFNFRYFGKTIILVLEEYILFLYFLQCSCRVYILIFFYFFLQIQCLIFVYVYVCVCPYSCFLSLYNMSDTTDFDAINHQSIPINSKISNLV